MTKKLIAGRRKIALVGGLVLALVLMGWVTSAFAITWGELDADNEYPNVGAMVVDHPDHGLWQRCSGTLIHPRVFLTAGHCTDGLEEDGITQVWVNLNRYALNEDTLLDVETIITHPDYLWGGSNPHDVGLLILAEPADVIPAELPSEGFLDDLKREGVLRPGGPDGAKFTVVGYGGVLDWHGGGPEGSGEPPEITYEDQRRFGESEYVALVPAQLHMNQNHLDYNEGTCFGDSGGPAFWEPDEDTRILVGITSWGDAMCVVTGFDYRVDIPETLSFIDDVIAGLP